MWTGAVRGTGASLRKGVAPVTSASNTISRVWILGSSPSGVVIAASPSPGPQAAQYLHRLRGLGPPGVVRIGVDGADGPFPVDHEARRDGQAPGAVPVALRQVDGELRVDRLQILGQGKDQPVLLGHAIAEIAQHLVGHGRRILRLVV